MDVVDQLYSRYGEGKPRGGGPSQETLFKLGNAYLEKKYPKLDFIKTARIEE